MPYLNTKTYNGDGIVDLFKMYFSFSYTTNLNNLPNFYLPTSLMDPIIVIILDKNIIYNELCFIKLTSLPVTNDFYLLIVLKECVFTIH